jgi:uncharacterized protein (TIGR02145 family)
MMKITTKCLILLEILALNLLAGCEKKQVPVITTTAVTNITATTATSGGNITDEGSSTVTSRGICWSTGTTPTTTDSKTSDGAGAGTFLSNITGLNGATVYYVRAFATNSVGTGYGMALSFTTLGQAPTPAGATATNINVTSVTLNGTVNANYLSTVVTFEYGTTTSYGSTATPSQSPVTGNTVTNVSSDITGLTAATIYHFRIKSVNSLGTTYSNDLTFTTLGLVPTVTTLAATSISSTGATLNGTVNANYLSTIVTFEYGTTTSYGSNAPATQSPLTGSTNTNVGSSITELTGGTIYHFRVKAVNSLGTSYGSDMTFTTLGLVPTVTTLTATIINQTSATMNGTVNANYLSSVVSFEYGTSTSYDGIATATQSPVTGSVNTSVSASITGLTQGTTYHFRVKAVNSLGTSYGSDLTFTTTSLTTVTDVDGNVYNIVTIGTQVWMKENLKTTKYSDGTAIPNITGGPAWVALTSPAYCWYNNDASTYKDTYGGMYNLYTVMTGKLCPTGWHVPSNADWTTLGTYLGGDAIAGGKLKEAGTAHWLSPNVGATNESGFNGLPTGFRGDDSNGTFFNINVVTNPNTNYSDWWSSTLINAGNAYHRDLYNNVASLDVRTDGRWKLGLPVRCMKD